jgi:hypothetical protein
MTKARDISKLLSTANGKIAGENLDVSFENITDTGTTGTRVATGTTAQRGSTAGQIRFNSDTGLAEYYDGSQFKSIDLPPTVTAVSPTDVASLDSGDATLTITGTNFQSGATVKFIANDNTTFNASSVTVNSSTSITAVAPNSSFSNSKEPYDIQITNTNGLSGSLDNQLYIDNLVTWNTASGTLATINTLSTGTHATVSATDPDGDTITYSEIGGTVLSTAGLTLNSSTGTISGQPNSAGTLNFTLRATANSKTADRAFSIQVNSVYSADFLVIAGGGGGGDLGGAGGGAGGYRNSYNSETSGGGGSAESSLTFGGGTVYTITVGAGGLGGFQPGNTSSYEGENGTNSSISGSGITTITSIGGGGGGHTYDGSNGGSGGGAGWNNRTGGSGTANQGYAGGNGASTNSPYSSAGGGGAGGVGGNSSGSSPGNGGSGVASTITGSSVSRAGGGAGGNRSGGSGSASAGGGSSGANGTANTGGGAAGSNSGTDYLGGGNGGSGVVILRMLASNYSGTTTGSPTVSDDGSYKVLTFTGSGSYTA